MRYFVTVGDRTFEVDLTGERPRVDGVEVTADLASVPGTTLHHLRMDGRSFPIGARPLEGRGRWVVWTEGREIEVEVLDERTRTLREMTGGHEVAAELTVSAPMPGLVVRLEVAVGDAVKAGQGVIVVEAMKMENELKAPADGVVARIEVEPGQAVEKGSVLMVLE
jgi:biotin carboxyl carrier protein